MSRVLVRFRRAGIIPPAFLVLKEAIYTGCGVGKGVPMGTCDYSAGQLPIMTNML